MRALYFEEQADKKVRCNLCPHKCLLKPGQTGICCVRTNIDGMLMADNYGKLSSIHVDPIEKKPLYHFFPGKKILSLGSVGCNMRCNFCQNCEISQTSVKEFEWLKEYDIEDAVNEAAAIPGNIGIAYTYNEPVVFYEFMLDSAKEIHNKGLKNIMVSNGYIEEKPLQELIPLIDAFNIDLKAFTDSFYKKQTHSSLEPVLHALEIIRKSGKHLEITNLIIPTLNDDIKIFREMIIWIAKTLGDNTILHLSRYFPRYQSEIHSTTENTLIQFKEIAEEFLQYVYLGNVGAEANTICPGCKNIVIERTGYQTRIIGLDKKGYCAGCGTQVVIQ
jgi:pyruvate formate lyase activating enzyme